MKGTLNENKKVERCSTRSTLLLSELPNDGVKSAVLNIEIQSYINVLLI